MFRLLKVIAVVEKQFQWFWGFHDSLILGVDIVCWASGIFFFRACYSHLLLGMYFTAHSSLIIMNPKNGYLISTGSNWYIFYNCNQKVNSVFCFYAEDETLQWYSILQISLTSQFSYFRYDKAKKRTWKEGYFVWLAIGYACGSYFLPCDKLPRTRVCLCMYMSCVFRSWTVC